MIQAYILDLIQEQAEKFVYIFRANVNKVRQFVCRHDMDRKRVKTDPPTFRCKKCHKEVRL